MTFVVLQEGGGSVSCPRSSSLRHSKANGSSSLEPSSVAEPPPKKSNWEVIEHYHKSGLVGSSSPRSPKEDDVHFQDDDESILHETRSWCDMPTLCLRIFKSPQFKNIHVEVLYQRYFLRMNQSNLTVLLALLIIVVSSIIGVSVYLTSDLSSYLIFIILGSLIIVYGIMEILLLRSCIQNEVGLYVLSYVILLSFFGLELLAMLAPEQQSLSSGVWAAIFFIYVTYTFLPLRLLEATAGGLLLMLEHFICTLFLSVQQSDRTIDWRPVSIDTTFLRISENQ